MSSFGRQLRRLRKAHGVSQQALALRAGTSQGYISEVERDRVSVRLDQADRLLHALGHELDIGVRRLPMRSDPDTLGELEALSAQERIERAAESFNFQARMREGLRDG